MQTYPCCCATLQGWCRGKCNGLFRPVQHLRAEKGGWSWKGVFWGRSRVGPWVGGGAESGAWTSSFPDTTLISRAAWSSLRLLRLRPPLEVASIWIDPSGLLQQSCREGLPGPVQVRIVLWVLKLWTANPMLFLNRQTVSSVSSTVQCIFWTDRGSDQCKGTLSTYLGEGHSSPNEAIPSCATWWGVRNQSILRLLGNGVKIQQKCWILGPPSTACLTTVLPAICPSIPHSSEVQLVHIHPSQGLWQHGKASTCLWTCLIPLILVWKLYGIFMTTLDWYKRLEFLIEVLIETPSLGQEIFILENILFRCVLQFYCFFLLSAFKLFIDFSRIFWHVSDVLGDIKMKLFF